MRILAELNIINENERRQNEIERSDIILNNILGTELLNESSRYIANHKIYKILQDF